VAFHNEIQRAIYCVQLLLTYLLNYILTYLLIYLLTCLFTYLPTPWSRVLLEKLTGFQLVKELPAFHETRRLITAVTSPRHLSVLSWATSIQSMPPHPTSWSSILILSSQLRLGLPSRISVRFPHQNPVHATRLPHTRYMPRPSHSRFYHPNDIGWGVQIIKLISMQFSLLPCHLVPLMPSILLNALFSNTLSLCSSLSVSDQVSHPYKTTGKIIVRATHINHISYENCTYDTFQ